MVREYTTTLVEAFYALARSARIQRWTYGQGSLHPPSVHGLIESGRTSEVGLRPLFYFAFQCPALPIKPLPAASLNSVSARSPTPASISSRSIFVARERLVCFVSILI